MDYRKQLIELFGPQYEPTEYEPTEYAVDESSGRSDLPGVHWIYLLELYLTEAGVLLFSNYQTSLPAYYPKILIESVPEFTRALPDPLVGFQGARSVTFTLSNIISEPDGSTEGLTFDQIALNEEIRGQTGVGRIYDQVTETDVERLDGRIHSYNIDESQWSVTITADDEALFQTPVPKVTTASLFPRTNFSQVSEAEDHTVLIPFGWWPRVDLPLCVATYLRTTFGMVTQVNNAIRVKLTGLPGPYTIQAGDILAYDILWEEDDAKVAFALEATDGTKLEDVGALDQHALDASALSDLNNHARNAWYGRSIDIPVSMTGKVLDFPYLVCRQATAGTYHARVTNAYITDADGNIRFTLFDQNINNPTFALEDTESGSNTWAVDHSETWDYGAIRGAAGVTAVNIYRNSAVVDPIEWDYVDTGIVVGGVSVKTIRFSVDLRNNSGELPAIKADFNSTEFSQNHALVADFIFTDTDFGLGLNTNAVSVTAAMNDFTTLEYKAGGGLSSQIPAIDVFRGTLLHGTLLGRNSAQEITFQVDTLAAHPTATLDLGRGDDRGLNNVLSLSTAREVSVDDWIKSLTGKALFDPGVRGEGQWALETVHARNVFGGKEETLEFPWVGNLKTLDEEIYFRFQRLINLDRLLKVEALQETVALEPGDITHLYAPNNKWNGADLEVREKTIGEPTLSFLLAPFNSTPFVYVPGTKQRPVNVTSFGADFSLTPPGAPLNPTLVGYVKRQTVTGGDEIFAHLRGDAPSVNVTSLVGVAFVAGSTISPIATTEIAPVTPGQTAIDVYLRVEPGLEYDFALYAKNSLNAPDFQKGVFAQPVGFMNQLVPGDTVAPPAPTVGTVIVTAYLKNFTVEWTGTDTKDLAGFVIKIEQLTPTTTILKTTEVGATPGTNKYRYTIELASVTYTAQVWAYVASKDKTGNESTFTAASNVAIINQVVTADLTVQSVTNPILASLAVANGNIQNLAVDTLKVQNLTVTQAQRTNLSIISGTNIFCGAANWEASGANQGVFPVSDSFAVTIFNAPLSVMYTNIARVLPTLQNLTGSTIAWTMINFDITDQNVNLVIRYW